MIRKLARLAAEAYRCVGVRCIGAGGATCRRVVVWAYRRPRGSACQRVLQSVINFVEDLLVIIGVSKSNLLPSRRDVSAYRRVGERGW